MKNLHVPVLCLLTLALAAGVALSAQAKPPSYKGLEVRVTGIERVTNLGLTDCPAGANTVRGVIRPGDANEFAAVKVDFKSTADFKAGTVVPKPVLTDQDGKPYNTAQSFAEIPASNSFSCTFAFRVPKGARVKSFAIDTLSIDVSNLGQ